MIWEVGILLMGVGVLILCIFAATTVRDLGASIKRIDRILTDKNGEIQTIITNAAEISTEVSGITANVNKATNIVGIVSSVAGIINKKKNQDETETVVFDEENLEDIFDSE